jgi:hypothetical protein
MMNAKEFWISKFPDAETDWGKTGHDDRFQVRMMEEYAEYRVKKDLIAGVGETFCRCNDSETPVDSAYCFKCAKNIK